MRTGRSFFNAAFRRNGQSKTPSRRSSASFLSSPPPYPVSCPDAPITRWQGTKMESGLRPLARPTARAGGRTADLPGDVRITACFSIGDGGQRLPDRTLKGCTDFKLQRQLELRAQAAEIFRKLLRGLLQQGRFPYLRIRRVFAVQQHVCDSAAVFREAQPADGSVVIENCFMAFVPFCPSYGSSALILPCFAQKIFQFRRKSFILYN